MNVSIPAFSRLSPGYKLLLYFGVPLLLAIALLAAVTYRQVMRISADSIDAHGQAVATQLAQTSLDAAMQQDMIALQAHLARLMKVPGIISAAIYDVQDTLLAQAGATPSELHGKHFLHHYTAALALGDNVAGRAVVTLDASVAEQSLPRLRNALLLIVTALLLLLAFLCRQLASQWQESQRAISRVLLEHLPPEIARAAPSTHRDILSPQDIDTLMTALQAHIAAVSAPPSPAAMQAAADTLLNHPGGRATLSLFCHNLPALQRQVSRERLRGLLERQHQHIETACRLYGGQRQPWAACGVRLVFGVTAQEQAGAVALQAACCGQVLAGVLRQCRDEELGIALQWSMVLDWQTAADNDLLRNCQQAQDEKRIQQLGSLLTPGELVISQALAEHLLAEDKLVLTRQENEGQPTHFRIERFADSHRKLLDGQVAQLLSVALSQP